MQFLFSQNLFCLSVLPPRQVSVLSAVADPGEGPGGRPPLFLDQTEARISFYAKDFHSGD